VSDEIHDFSRVDKFMAARRRSMLLHAAWRPMLAGAIGAAIIVGAVWAASPKLRFNEIEVSRITLKDLEVPRVVLRDVAVDHIIPHDVEVDHIVQRDVEATHGPAGAPTAYEPSGPSPSPAAPSNPVAPSSQPATAPAASSPTAAGPSTAIQDGPVSQAQSKPVQSTPNTSDRPSTPEEKKFTESPSYKNATYRGRIVKSADGRALSFADGKNFFPAHWDGAARKLVDDPGDAVDSEDYVGDLGLCAPEGHDVELWRCVALHGGVEIEIVNKPIQPPKPFAQKAASADAKPGPMGSPAVAVDMVRVQVDLGGGTMVEALVDTGASWPMSLPAFLADKLVAKNLATRRPKSKARVAYADGSRHELDAISIKRVVVNGRALENVLASVVPSSQAPVLLGLGALNRLGAFSIDNGKLVFATAARAG
jgi:predicted aspartyl protease